MEQPSRMFVTVILFSGSDFRPGIVPRGDIGRGSSRATYQMTRESGRLSASQRTHGSLGRFTARWVGLILSQPKVQM